MSNDLNQPPIDVVAESPVIEPSPVTEPLPRRRCRWIAVIIVILLLCIAAMVSWEYLHVQSLQARIEQSVNNDRDVTIQLAEVTAQTHQQQQAITELSARVASAVVPEQTAVRLWTLIEAQSLIQLADYNLQFQGNVVACLQLLSMADAKIATLADPTLLPVREALANDQAALQLQSTTDTAGILLQLNGLNQSIAALPTLTAQVPTVAPSKPAESLTTWSAWRQTLADMWQSFKSMIVIRHHTDTIDPLLMAADHAYLNQHLHLLLAQVQWAVLHQQTVVYSTGLQQAIAWVQQYYVPDAPQTQGFVQALQQLAQRNVQPKYSGVSASLKAISQLMPLNQVVTSRPVVQTPVSSATASPAPTMATPPAAALPQGGIAL